MRLDDFDTSEAVEAVLLSSQPITAEAAAEEVRELILEVEDPDFTVQIGQSIGVVVPGPFNTADRRTHPAELGHSHHYRLYTVADLPALTGSGKPEIKICVRRCGYIDEYSGEEYPGIASNYLCDLGVGSTLSIKGPFGMPFTVPEDRNAELVLVGMGTGIAPFRALVKHIYQNVKDWRGRIRLFHGARSGLEMLYMNDQIDDFSQYYDEETFLAIKALSPRPHWGDPVDMHGSLTEFGGDIVEILSKPEGYIYVAGQEEVLHGLESALSAIVGGEKDWLALKDNLVETRRWQELIY